MDIQLKHALNQIKSLLHRFHVVIFVVVVFGSLAVAVFVLSSLLQASSDGSGSVVNDSGLNANFDKETIERIGKLRTGKDGSGDIPLPSGRINPFAE